tara:strand:+ start:993 stop:1226 length:234 start_codon:yes stop_codon:yes gene_type:complete
MSDIRNKVRLKHIFKMALRREKIGKREYGLESYHKLNLYDELIEELLDVIVYSYLEILKIMKLREKKLELTKEQNGL